MPWQIVRANGAMRSFAITILMAFLLLPRAGAQSAAMAEIPFEFRGGLIWIEVSVPQTARSLKFILDSGAEVSALNLQTVRSLGLSVGRVVTVQCVQSVAKGFWPEHLLANAGAVSLPKNYLAVDLNDLSRACGVTVDGLIGADFFRAHLVQIDFAAQKIRLLKSISPGGHAAILPLKARRGRLQVSLQINDGEPIWVRLDTGCASSMQWVNAGSPTHRYPGETAVGITPVSIPQDRTTVRIGPLEFKAVPTGMHTEQIFPGEDGLLGSGLLSRFALVTVDSGAGRVFFDGAPAPGQLASDSNPATALALR